MGFSVSIGAWITLLMWLVTENAWVGVFALGVSLGICLLEKWLLSDEVQRLQDENRALELEMYKLGAETPR
jgi:hypothetical protein